MAGTKSFSICLSSASFAGIASRQYDARVRSGIALVSMAATLSPAAPSSVTLVPPSSPKE